MKTLINSLTRSVAIRAQL